MVKLEDYTLKQLKEIASKFNKMVKLPAYSKEKKVDLIKILRNHKQLTIIEGGDKLKMYVNKNDFNPELKETFKKSFNKKIEVKKVEKKQPEKEKVKKVEVKKVEVKKVEVKKVEKKQPKKEKVKIEESKESFSEFKKKTLEKYNEIKKNVPDGDIRPYNSKGNKGFVTMSDLDGLSKLEDLEKMFDKKTIQNIKINSNTFKDSILRSLFYLKHNGVDAEKKYKKVIKLSTNYRSNVRRLYNQKKKKK